MTITKILGQSTFPVPIGYCIDWIYNPGNIKTVAMQCPICKQAFCLKNHNIAMGVVSPSVVCPHGCGFHEFLVIN